MIKKPIDQINTEPAGTEVWLEWVSDDTGPVLEHAILREGCDAEQSTRIMGYEELQNAYDSYRVLATREIASITAVPACYQGPYVHDSMLVLAYNDGTMYERGTRDASWQQIKPPEAPQ